MYQLYDGIVNSPETELTQNITATQTTIPVKDAFKLPAPPNLAVIGRNEDAETILYTGKSGNTLTGVTRGFQGQARSWKAGAPVARRFTEYDWRAIKENFLEHITNTVTELINVKEKGAAGDGTTDDTAILQAIIDNAPDNAVLYFPGRNRTYLISTLTINKNIVLMGEATLKHTASATNSMIVTLSDSTPVKITVVGLTFDGNKANRIDKQDDILSNTSIISTKGANKHLECRYCTFKNTLRAAITVRSSAFIEGCAFENGAQHNGTSATFYIYAMPVGDDKPYLSVTNCVFKCEDTSASALASNPGGIFVTEYNGYVYEKVIVSKNRFYGIGTSTNGNVTGAVDTYNGAKEVIVTDNHVDGFSYSAFKLQRCDNAIVANNVVLRGENTLDNACFAILYEPKARSGTDPHYNAIIASNIIKDVHRTAIQIAEPGYAICTGNIIENVLESDNGVCEPIIVGANCNFVVIANNLIRGFVDKAVYFYSGTRDILIQDNIIHDNGSASAGTGIEVLNGGTRLRIERNHIYKASSGFYGIAVRNTVDSIIRDNVVVGGAYGIDVRNNSNLILEGNRCVSYTTGPMYDDGKNTNMQRRHNSFDQAVTWGTAVPTSGSWDRGDIVYNLSPASGGKIGWVCVRSGQAAPAWQPSKSSAVGDVVVPTTDNGHYYQCTVAGTSGTTEPTWPTTPGATVTDGTVTWQEAGTSALFKAFGAIDP